MADLAASKPDRMATDVAFMFPGQGSQKVGMGRELVETSSQARLVFERADQALGWSLSRLCFEGPIEELTRTENLQPALFTVSMAVHAALQAAGEFSPGVALGHSLGEYAALVAGSALDFDDALHLVRRRGELMASAVPEGQGAMAAVIGLDPDSVTRVCEEQAGPDVLSLANLNAPGQVVISGHSQAVERAKEPMKEAGAKGMIPLKVSAPFHCSLMQPAADGLAEVLSRLTISSPAYPVLSNVTARPHGDPDSIKRLLVDQLVSPVRWTESIAWARENGVARFLEIGSGKVLAGLLKRIDRRTPSLAIADPETVARVAQFVQGEN